MHVEVEYQVRYLAVLLVACGGHYTTIPNQEAAVEVVWHGVYNQTLSPPPPIQWTTPNCGYPKLDNLQGFWRDGVSGYSGGVCLLGEYHDPPEDYIELAPNPKGLFSNGALAHELNHARLRYDAGDADPDHLGDCWYPCREDVPTRDCDLLGDAIDALRSQGL